MLVILSDTVKYMFKKNTLRAGEMAAEDTIMHK